MLGSLQCACIRISRYIEEVQYIRNIFYSGAEVYNRNLGVVISEENFINGQNGITCLIAHTKSQLSTL